MERGLSTVKEDRKDEWEGHFKRPPAHNFMAFAHTKKFLLEELLAPVPHVHCPPYTWKNLRSMFLLPYQTPLSFLEPSNPTEKPITTYISLPAVLFRVSVLKVFIMKCL